LSDGLWFFRVLLGCFHDHAMLFLPLVTLLVGTHVVTSVLSRYTCHVFALSTLEVV